MKRKNRTSNRDTTSIDWVTLEDDLCRAARAAARIDGNDDGPSNLDCVALRLPHVRLARIEAAAKAAGVGVYRAYARVFHVMIPGSHRYQGHVKTKRARAMAKRLSARGWDASVQYILD